MSNRVVSVRYASALFSIGREAGTEALERCGTALSALGDAVKKTPKLAEAFRNPVLSPEEKKKLVLSLLDIAGGGETERRFCSLLADKDRLTLLPDIAKDFSAMLDEANGLSRGVVTTAIALDDAHREAVKNKLESQTGRRLALEYVVDPAIIGGIVLRVGDMVYDASLRAQLDNLRESVKRGE